MNTQHPGLIANLLVSDKHPLMPRVCDACYDTLTQSLSEAGHHNVVAIHCPHYMVLVRVEIVDGLPLGVTAMGPITIDEASAIININSLPPES